MTKDSRKTIDNCKKLQDLMHSEKWANDNIGRYYNEALALIKSLPGVTEEDALEYLHEED